jgi:Putative  PD-(D/E)XK family member, (DUF4420)
MKSAELQQIWEQLRTSADADNGEGFRLRLCLAHAGLRVFAATEVGSERVAAVLDLPRDMAPRSVSTSPFRRISIQVSDFAGLPPGRAALIIKLLDREFQGLFGSFTQDVIEGVAQTSTTGAGVTAVLRIIARWRRFLESRTAPLSNEEVRGLVGELAVLERLIASKGAAVALASWKSPAGSIRDFECPDLTIEAKTYTPSGGAKVWISNPLQLEPDHGIRLILACQELARSDAGDATLPAHVARIRALIPASSVLRDDYDDLLASSGYLPAHAEFYPDGLTLGSLVAFSVTPAFPRISRPSALPGIDDITFSLRIASLEPFKVDAETVVWPRMTEQP